MITGGFLLVVLVPGAKPPRWVCEDNAEVTPWNVLENTAPQSVSLRIGFPQTCLDIIGDAIAFVTVPLEMGKE